MLLSAGGLRCGSATATTLAVSWDAVADTDLYYVALAAHKGGAPYALQTTAAPNTTLLDLVPNQTYHVTVRSHPSSDNIVWGWRAPEAEVVCMTAAVRLHAPHSLRRQGNVPSERAIAPGWLAKLESRIVGSLWATRVVRALPNCFVRKTSG